MRALAIACLCFAGCSEILVTITDPLAIADGATTLNVGDGDDVVPIDIREETFLMSIVVENPGPPSARTFVAEAFDDEFALARGQVELDFERDARAELELRPLCDDDNVCAAPFGDNVCCVGVGFCVEADAACPVGSEPADVNFALAFEAGDVALAEGFNVPPSNGSDGLTLEAWVSLDEDCAIQGGCTSDVVGKAGHWTMRFSSVGGQHTLEGRLVGEDGGRASPEANAPIQTGRGFTHVALTYDGQVARVFVDGQEVGSSPAPVQLATGTDPVRLGGRELGMIIDQVRIWSVARTQAELVASRNATFDGDEAGLVVAWRLDEGFGQRAAPQGEEGFVLSLGESVDEDARDPEWVVRDP